MNWDILTLDDGDEWPHMALLDRLHDGGIDCYFADMWGSEEIAFLIGCKADVDELANVLNMYKEAIYVDQEHCFVILNLFQEKTLRINPNRRR